MLMARFARRTAPEPLDDRPGEHVQGQVVRASGLGARAAQAEAAEGLDAGQGAGYAAVEVDVACLELVAGALEVVAVLGVDAAGAAGGGVGGELGGVGEAAGPEA